MTATDAVVKCTFHESQSPSEGNPDTFWSIELRHYRGRWLIDNYGQP
jgi:lipocalin